MKPKRAVPTPRFIVSYTSWLGRQIAVYSPMYFTTTHDGYVLDGREYLTVAELAYGPLRRGDHVYA